MIIVGLMSGTSADGIDAALVDISGTPPALRWQVLAHTTLPHPAALRAEILACCQPEQSSVERICLLNVALGEAFATAAEHVTRLAGHSMSDIDLIGSHGQTIWHVPGRATFQIGEAAVIAERCGVPVISNFRAADIAAGGQGAPLVAAVDALLFSHPEKSRVLQNIGGIANLTYLPAGFTLNDTTAIAFDTGPGNMLIDHAIARITKDAQQYDHDGIMAGAGRIHQGLLTDMLKHPFFLQTPPKTTGRELFGASYGEAVAQLATKLAVSDRDLLATLTAFTAHSIARAYQSFLPGMPDEVLISGGGTRNQTLMRMLKLLLAPAQVLRSDDVGLLAEAKEALAFAVLAYESWHGRPGNLPSATGARRAVVLGTLTLGVRGRGAGTQHLVAVQHLAAVQHPAALPHSDIPLTELRNPASVNIDLMETPELVALMNREDSSVAGAVQSELGPIAAAIDAITARMRQGGRLIYVGAGTSGRLGVLDASECPPTYSTPPELVLGLIAGGQQALTRSIEGAEDDQQAGAQAIAELQLSAQDSLVGIAASGNTPYVAGAMAEARRRGALTISLTCSLPARLAELADIAIAPIVGPEIVTGSTRMKAGTAQKLVLNMLSTGVMIRLGKTYGNLMVDVQPTNQKLRKRAIRIIREICAVDDHTAQTALDSSQGQIKVAVLMLLQNLRADEARQRLEQAGGVIRKALKKDNT